jgi:hypothetical protein
MMLETRFALILRSDTDDPDEARQDALDFIASSKEGWYSSINLDSEIEVIDALDDLDDADQYGPDTAAQQIERGPR